jgi:hypothetical protein
MSNRHMTIDIPTGQHAPTRNPLTFEEQTRKRIADRRIYFFDTFVTPFAVGATVVSFFFMFWLFIGVAGWQNILPATAMAGMYTALLAGLPALTAMLPQKEHELIWSAWMICVLIGVGAFAYYIASQDSWSALPEARVFSSNSGAAAKLAKATNMSESALLKLGWLGAGIILMGVSGIAARYAIMGPELALREIFDVAPTRATITEEQQALLGIASQDNVIDWWFTSNTREAKGAYMPSSKAYDDYVRTCHQNATEPVAKRKFFLWLNRKAEDSSGKFLPEKSHGNMGYRGLKLTRDECDVIETSFDEVPKLEVRR